MKKRVMVDFFSGKWGWSQAFAARNWHCVGIDILPRQIAEASMPRNCTYIQWDVLEINGDNFWQVSPDKFPDFACASSPCEEFSLFGMRMFHKNPPHPEMGIKLFNHTKRLLEHFQIPYVMENVRAAQDFVGESVHNCGPFHLWGSAVPLLMPQGIKKGFKLGTGALVRQLKETGDKRALVEYRKKMDCWNSSKSPQRIANTAKMATIPPELACCVVDYAERILEQRDAAKSA